MSAKQLPMDPWLAHTCASTQRLCTYLIIFLSLASLVISLFAEVIVPYVILAFLLAAIVYIGCGLYIRNFFARLERCLAEL